MKINVKRSGIVLALILLLCCVTAGCTKEKKVVTDIEQLNSRFAASMDMKPDFGIYTFKGLISEAAEGSIDCIMPQLLVTEKRAQSIDFSDSVYTSGISLAVQNESGTDGFVPLETACYGVMQGSVVDQLIKKNYPDSKINVYNSFTDACIALNGGKTDYVVIDYNSAVAVMKKEPNLTIVPDIVLQSKDVGIVLPKGQGELLANINQVLRQFKEDGTLDTIVANWTTPGQDYVVTDIPESDGKNGTLHVAITTGIEPAIFMMDGKYRGLNIELIERIAFELGMKVEYQSMEFGALVPAIASGKADLAISDIAITEERKQSVDFSDPYYVDRQILLTRKAETVSSSSWLSSVGSSFRKTFLVEARWKLILEGLGVTIGISLLSGIFGSLFGFALCMLRRKNNSCLRMVCAGFVRLVQGTPIVVLLMLMYYVVFARLNLPAVPVAVIAFSINFGAYVSEMIRSGIDAVDKGQIEAAEALGYSKRQTFWKVTFPQAARHFLPVFKGEFISMVKMTSVVGYIAVLDLTKMTDIIRSRTMEAFFPLIVTAFIYFAISNLMAMALSIIEIRIDPKRRPRTVKGVKL